MSKIKKDFLSLLKNESIRKDIITAFDQLDQKLFFDKIFHGYFYSNEPIPIGHGERGEPSGILAKMINYLEPDKSARVLEIGTGSGYSTAVLSKLFDEVLTVEYYEDMALAAKERITNLKISNVRFLCGDINGLDSLPGVFDRVIIFTACPERPLFFMPYLKKGGIMVFPMGPDYQQQIIRLKNEPGENESLYKMNFFDLCNFKPVIINE
ncbi:MAG: methyltransferase domain-containing protein [Spirochaetes bacterium]|nr:methyltransferase domain-containing protein [Spirochaetota bacterium]